PWERSSPRRELLRILRFLRGCGTFMGVGWADVPPRDPPGAVPVLTKPPPPWVGVTLVGRTGDQVGVVALPERLPLPLLAAVQRPHLADPVRAVLPPAHPRQLQPLPHHRLARALHRTAAEVPALRLVLRVLHPVQVLAEVLRHLGQLRPYRRPPRRPVPFAQHRQRRRPPFLLEQLAPRRRLRLGRLRVLRVQRLGQVAQ